MPGIASGAAFAEAPASPEPPPAPSTPKRPRKRPHTTSPSKAASSYNLPRIDFFPGFLHAPDNTQESPQDQLGLELQEYVADAFHAKHSKLEQLKEDVSKLTAWVSQITTQWGNSGLPEARAIGSDARDFVKNLSQKISGHPPKTDANSHAAQAPSSYADAVKSNGGTAAAAIPPTKPLQPTAKASPSSKPPRIFIRLPADHHARTASPHATLAHLQQLPELQGASRVREVQRVPSGLALQPQGLAETAQIFSHKAIIESAITGSTVEIEQEWETHTLYNVPRSYRAYTGELVEISENAAKEEFIRQTGLAPQRFFASQKDPGSGTFFMMTPKDPHTRIPPRVSLFSHPVTVRHRPKRARVTQCRQCWGFHNSLKCTRKPRCRVCGSKEHVEESHQANQQPLPSCTNCLGKHTADHPDCPLRPVMKQGTLQRPSKGQVRALRRAGLHQRNRDEEQHRHRTASSGSPAHSPQ